MKSNATYFNDIWFSGVKRAEELMPEGLDYCGPVKTSHEGFCLATLENLMNDWPGGSYIMIKSTPRAPHDRPLMAIGSSLFGQATSPLRWEKVLITYGKYGGGINRFSKSRRQIYSGVENFI